MIKQFLNFLIVKLKNRCSSIHSFDVSRFTTIGRNVWISKGVIIKKGVYIGENSYVNANSIIVSGDIGKYCSIGYNVLIGPEEHPIDQVTTSPKAFSLNNITYKQSKNPPVIGDDVWIAANAVVLRGVNIGDGAVIAAGAVVTKDVEPYSIVAGIPAKQISKRKFSDRSWIK